MVGLFQQYEQLPGGQTESRHIANRRSRQQLRRSLWLSGVFSAVSLTILVAAFHRNPHWFNPVGELEEQQQQKQQKQAMSASSSTPAAAISSPITSPPPPPLEFSYDPGDTLPRIDWTWKEEESWLGSVPEIGSQAWLKRYPGFVHGPEPRKSWLTRYNAAVSAGLIPSLAKAELIGGLANYPETLAIDEKLCSYRRASCTAPDDIVRAPTASWAINFDDGPLPPSEALYKALDGWNEKATHFWVGNNVKTNWELAVQAAERGDHLAVHTWSHPHLTTYTNEQIVGELGWTMQIIYDVSLHLPKYYRPPFGDVDNRVRAIAKHVFNMTAVMWNYDSFDWSLNQTWARGDFIDPPYDWLTTELSTKRLADRMAENDAINGEGVIALEHELSFESVQAFTDSHAHIGSNGWRCGTVPDLLDLPWYQ